MRSRWGTETSKKNLGLTHKAWDGLINKHTKLDIEVVPYLKISQFCRTQIVD